MKALILVLFAAFLAHAGSITLSTSVGSIIDGAGVDMELTVWPDGTVTYGLSALQDSVNWGLQTGILLPPAPEGDTVQSASISFGEPESLLSPEVLYPILSGTVSSTLDSLEWDEIGCPGASQSMLPMEGVEFTPCSSFAGVGITFGGSADIQLNSWTVPSVPGTYENALLLAEDIQVSLLVDYSDPIEVDVSGPSSEAPELSSFFGILTGFLFLLGLGFLQGRSQPGISQGAASE
jgi:hypothetical protein